MIVPQTKRIVALCLSMSSSLLWGMVLSNWTVVQKLELSLQDQLIRLRPLEKVPDNILLVKLEETTVREREIFLDPSFYTTLANRLLEEGAAVVILNLRQTWLQEGREVSTGFLQLKRLIEQQGEKLILVTPIPPVRSYLPEMKTYNRLLPFSTNDVNYVIKPENIQGFFEYENEAENPENLTSSARQAHLMSQFFPVDNPEQVTMFKSLAVLALEKIQKSPFKDYQRKIQINFIAPNQTFDSLALEDFCDLSIEEDCQDLSHKQYRDQVENKIVIIGFVYDQDNKKALTITSPFGQKIPGVEVQGNLVASLQTEKYYQLADYHFNFLILMIGGIILGLGIVPIEFFSLPKNQTLSRKIFNILPWIGIYLGLSLISWWSRLILPVILPLLSWLCTGILISIWTRFEIQEALIVQQQHEINQLKSTEQAAIIAQTRKLLYRTASDIHDGPLQELKLIMDEIELNAMPETDTLLDKLEAVGHKIRQYLNNIRGSAEKLEITPELRDGLDQGIRYKLEQLMEKGELKLKVICDLSPLQEPLLNSAWIDAREDIYRFFREAITNVMRHGQPPQGTATQLTVHLFQYQEECTLIIANDTSSQKNNLNRSRSGGYGTKIMTTIASELPDGYWERKTLEDGEIQVKLVWKLNFN